MLRIGLRTLFDECILVPTMDKNLTSKSSKVNSGFLLKVYVQNMILLLNTFSFLKS